MTRKYWLGLLLASIYIFSYPIIAASNARVDLSEINSWSIELDSPDMASLETSDYDLIVIDYALDGTDQTAYSQDQITELKNSGKKVLAYLCIGKAETNRFYFESDWQTGDPKILGPLESEGNYHVKFWKESWFDKVLQPYLDRILTQGFDGVYLEGIDEEVDYWITQGYSAEKISKHMVKLIREIAHSGRKTYGKEFIVCPQNTQTTLDHLSEAWAYRYQNSVDCFGISNLYSDTSSDNSQLISKISELDTQKILDVEDASDSETLTSDSQETSVSATSKSKIITYLRRRTTPTPSPTPAPTAYQGMSLPSSFQAFASSSIWNTPIGSNPVIDSASSSMINTLKAAASTFKGNMYNWTVPVHVIDSSISPQVTVYAKSSSVFYGSVDPQSIGQAVVPFPTGVWADPKTDAHMCLVDPVLKKAWDFSKLSFENNQWMASRVDVWDLVSSGTRTPFSGINWWKSGARGSGMPLIAGLIRVEEIQTGVIRHALVFASPTNRFSTSSGQKDQLCIPANRTDGWGIGSQYIPEGARLQLDPSLNLDSLGLNAETKIVAKALQDYGMFNGDNSNDFNIYFQNLGSSTTTTAWSPYSFQLSKIPVDRFRVLSCDIVTRS